MLDFEMRQVPLQQRIIPAGMEWVAFEDSDQRQPATLEKTILFKRMMRIG